MKLDVDDAADISHAYDYITNNYGKLDILVNNAGIQIEQDGFGANTTATTEEAVLTQTFATNFFNVVKLTNTLLPLNSKKRCRPHCKP